MDFLSNINSVISGSLLTSVLFICGIFCHIKYHGFVFFKQKRIIKSILTKSHGKTSGNSPLSAVTLALAGTLGVGNITGVATAVSCGGAGAVFWMWISSIVSASLKYSEVVLAVKYRDKTEDGYKGGAVSYIRKALKSEKTAIFFCVLCIFSSFTIGNMIQINAAAESFDYVFGIPKVLTGAAVSVFCFFIINNGLKSISSFVNKLVPLLSLLFCAVSAYIIITNAGLIPSVFKSIIYDAFGIRQISSGISGFAVKQSMRYGIARGIASNESGCGTAPYAHASSNTDSAVKQGFLGIFEVIADTVVICSLTAFVILMSPYYKSGLDGMELALKSFEYQIGPIAPYFLGISVMFFAVSSIICWSYYGTESVFAVNNKKIYTKAYIFLFCIITVIGSFCSSNLIWELSDLSLSLMALLNTGCILFLSGEVKEMTDDFFNK